MIVLGEEVMVGVDIVHMGDHLALCIAGDQVLTMVDLAVLLMTDTMALHMTSAGVLIMVGT